MYNSNYSDVEMISFADLRIRPKLIALLIIFGILPMVCVTLFSGRMASEALIKKSFQELLAIQTLRSASIDTFFEKRLLDIGTLAGTDELRDFATGLTTGVSVNYSIEEVEDSVISSFTSAYDYNDFFVLSPDKGKILYALHDKSRINANSLSYENTDPSLAKVWAKTVAKSTTYFTDFAKSKAAQGQYVAYFSAPILDHDGNLIAIAAMQVSPQLVTKIVDSRVGMGETGESYLLGLDATSNQFTLRSDIVTMGNGRYVVGFRLGYDLDYWTDARSAGDTGGQGTYIDSAGRPVLVTFNRIQVPGYDWYLISKINQDEVTTPITRIYQALTIITAMIFVLICFVAIKFSNSVTSPLLASMDFAQHIAKGKLDSSLTIDRKDELGELGSSLNNMASQLRDLDWLKSGKETLDNELRGDIELSELSNRFIRFFTRHLNAQLGAFYLFENGQLELNASYAFSDRAGNFNRIQIGEGMVGQASLEQQVIAFNHVTDEAPVYNFAAGDCVPTHFLAIPLCVDKQLIGTVLLGAFHEFSPIQRRFINEVVGNLAIVFNATKARLVIKSLLEETQQQKAHLSKANEDLEAQTQALRVSEEELQAQQEELRVTNEELEEQTKVLRASEAELQAQQEELRVTNEELEERTKALESQQVEMKEKNEALHQAQLVVEEKAKELEIASKYKSEFLANMSHELRTPLNSILILSQLFANNKDGNLTAKQIESAKAINSSGSDLLSLINEILDLSKVEAGKIDLHIEDVPLQTVEQDLLRLYQDIADDKGLDFQVICAPNLPQTLETDAQRLQQILRNLLTNAFKFTHEGAVTLNMALPSPEQAKLLDKPREALIAFSVKDDGIGIKQEQQLAIFQAFQQADGSTSRKYGGTGLGLSISKELTHLLGGRIHIKSEEGKGSIFTVIFPTRYEVKESESQPTLSPISLAPMEPMDVVEREEPTPPAQDAPSVEKEPIPQLNGFKKADSIKQDNDSYVEDDRQTVVPEDRTLLIIEDDRAFASVMRDFGRERGFKCIVAETGETGLHFAQYYKPSAIILDIGLPGIDGWTVMERLKENPETRHIPVHFMSANDANLDALRMGAIGYLTKPVDMKKLEKAFGNIEDILSKPVKRLLVVEDDAIQQESIRQLIGEDDIHIVAVPTGEKALEELESNRYDCMVLDLGLEDMTGFELLERIRRSETAARVPIIVYTGRELSKEEERELNRYAESIIIKGVKSPERLLDESALFLHRVEANLPSEQRGILRAVHNKESVLTGKKVLLVDDDMRNVFALSSILEDKGMDIVIARDGLESLDKLKENPDIDVVLMDIMMPKMDGYEAMEEIRKQKVYEKLPVIALTAKAMKGDRSKCIEAGASDYLAKPVNTDKLLSMLRVWLY
ncbi:response regulator [Vibrio vulnificus]|uniref:response regulator n=2 Tax=Vibrio vulnificus TaxID=672 RepID=UPI00289301CB|nr:response regulator [Vibrio vulnificus]WNJ73099.1 response regulator [Vibrio vulnificus]